MWKADTIQSCTEAYSELLYGLQSEVQSGAGGKARDGNLHLQELRENGNHSGKRPALAGSLSGVQNKTAAAEYNKKMPQLWQVFHFQLQREALAGLLPFLSGKEEKLITTDDKKTEWNNHS